MSDWLDICYYRAKINQQQYTINRIMRVNNADNSAKSRHEISVILNEYYKKIAEIDEHAGDENYFK